MALYVFRPTKICNISINILQTFVRHKYNYSNRVKWPRVLKTWVGGKRYPGFWYYPKHPDEVDPEIEPAKAFMVQRVKPYWGIPYWEKEILVQLGIDRKTTDIGIVLNNAHNCAKLWKVKHLIKIKPIIFPDGIPEEGNLMGTYLNRFGELEIPKDLKVDSARLKAAEESMSNPRQLEHEDTEKHCRYKWLFPTI